MPYKREIALGFLVGLLYWPSDARAVTTYALFNAAGNCAWDTATSHFVPSYVGDLTLETARATATEHRIACDFAGSVPVSDEYSAYIYFYDSVSATDMTDDFYCNLYSCNTSGSSCSNAGTRFGNATGGTGSAVPYSDGDGFVQWLYVSRTAFTTTEAWCNIPGANGTQRGRIKRFWINWIT